MNANLKGLHRIHGDNAGKVFEQIADLGGYGKVGDGEGHISAAYEGGLDLAGVLDENNTAISSAAKDKIAELAGVDRKQADKVAAGGGESSAGKMAGKEK